MNFIKRHVPLVGALENYNARLFKNDLAAGLTVGVMLIPQGMAYAMLAGLPPIYGLYASTIPLILYALFGTSRQLAVGPVAMVALLIATGVSQLAAYQSENYIALAILLALMVGVMQFSLGLFRLGFLVNFLSHPVISGFTSAAALIIGLSQLKHLLGIDIPRSNFIHEILINAGTHLGDVHIATFVLGATAIALILTIKKLKWPVPGPLVVVVLSILVVYFFGLDKGGMKIVKEVPEGLPPFHFPGFEMGDLKALLPIALTIALVGFMESIAVAKAIQAKHKNYQVDSNQELIALGVANIGGAFFSSFPTTGGFSRTAVNDQAGAKTGLASIISAVLILLTLIFLTPLFYYLPKAVLASVIMVAVFGLIDIKEAKHLWKSDKRDFAMLAVTFIATLTMGIEQGIIIGVALSLVMVVYRAAYPHMAQLGRLPGTNYYRNVKRFPDADQREDMLIARFDAQLFFANIGYLRDKLQKMELEKGDKLKVVVLNAAAINGIDSSALHQLHDVVVDYHNRGIEFYVAGVKGPVRDKMMQDGLVDLIGKSNFFMHVADAVAHYEKNNEEKIRNEENVDMSTQYNRLTTQESK
ncbi:MAG TPA: sodium-independent anion transporter [Cytophagales bacterium]|jgi:SulP family sulfate permease|nr:sodium-independent anion transporter [Cytophagales bacterium]